jgi:hypothetical protein
MDLWQLSAVHEYSKSWHVQKSAVLLCLKYSKVERVRHRVF